MSNNITTVGIDIAKNVFQLHAIDERGKAVMSKRIRRDRLLSTVAKLPPCLIGMEACGSAHYWAQKFETQGHVVKLMSPQYVKPYVKGNKTDAADAIGIAEAVTRPSMRFVSIKKPHQQDIQTIHRLREQGIKQRTAMMNSLRGLLLEYGIAIQVGKSHLYARLSELTEAECTLLSDVLKTAVKQQFELLQRIDEQVTSYDAMLSRVVKENELCQRLITLAGFGEKISTGLVAAVNDGSEFKNGRVLSSWLGLTPRENSSGDRQQLLGISKRGDRYLRSLVIHGARSVVQAVLRSERMDPHSMWVRVLVERCGKNKATVAVANKNVRMAHALLRGDGTYDPLLAHLCPSKKPADLSQFVEAA